MLEFQLITNLSSFDYIFFNKADQLHFQQFSFMQYAYFRFLFSSFLVEKVLIVLFMGRKSHLF